MSRIVAWLNGMDTQDLITDTGYWLTSLREQEIRLSQRIPLPKTSPILRRADSDLNLGHPPCNNKSMRPDELVSCHRVFKTGYKD